MCTNIRFWNFEILNGRLSLPRNTICEDTEDALEFTLEHIVEASSIPDMGSHNHRPNCCVVANFPRTHQGPSINRPIEWIAT